MKALIGSRDLGSQLTVYDTGLLGRRNIGPKRDIREAIEKHRLEQWVEPVEQNPAPVESSSSQGQYAQSTSDNRRRRLFV